MANITLSVSDDFKSRMDAHTEIKWSNAIRSIIEQKLDNLDEANKLAQKSRLTSKDVEEFSERINKKLNRHVRKLLDEDSR